MKNKFSIFIILVLAFQLSCNRRHHSPFPLSILFILQFELVIIKFQKDMDQQFQTELEATKASFYKLQDNFNHNLLVIKQLEQDNEKLIHQNESLKLYYHKEIDQLYASIEELKDENKKLNGVIKAEVAKTRTACEEETQAIVEMMNERMMEEKRFQAQKIARERKDAQVEIQKYEESIKHYSLENSKLNQAIKQLRNEKDSLQSQLQSLFSQKEAYSNKFSLHQKELENIRAANEQWQALLKQKVKEANKEKQKVEEELSETKLACKMKLKTMKEEAAKKIEEIQSSKEKSLRAITQEAKEIKFRFDVTCQELEKLKAEAKIFEKERSKMEEKIKELEKQGNSEKEVQYLKRMHEQEKIQLKGQNKLIENERNNLKEELKEVNQRREEVEKTVERLKTALLAAQKDIGEGEKKNKKLEKEIRELRNEAKRFAEATNMNFKGFQKFQAQDIVNQNPAQNQQNMDYSKYFSEDMGPADEMFFMQNSVPRSPKNASNPQGPSPVNHQLMKKIGELQVETDQYKNVIKTMSEEMQRTKSVFSDQISMKDQEIKLTRDQIHLLREKINEREQQLLGLNGLRQQNEDKSRKIRQLEDRIEKMAAELKEKIAVGKKVEAQLTQLREKYSELEQKCNNCEQEKNIIDEINEELRAEIHQYKNRIKLYNESQQQSSRAEQQQFQEIRFDQSSQEDVLKRSQQFRKSSKSKSRSKSGKKRQSNIQPQSQSHLLQGSKTSIKLKDLVLRKKQLEMEGKKMNIQYKEPNTNKNIQKTGTESQKEILETMRRKSRSKGKDRAERLKKLDYDRLMGRKDNENDDVQ